MADGCCAACAYVGRVHNGDPDELICVNSLVAPGEPVRVRAESVCPNFRAQRRPTPRPYTTTPSVLPPSPNDQVRYIPLSKNLFATVDARDYPELSKYKWTASGRPGFHYAVRRENNKVIYMHRQIMPPPPGMVTDHTDGNRLHNRRDNLRNCTQQENAWNSRAKGSNTGFKGVWYSKDRRQYEASVWLNGEKIILGWFDDRVEAAHVRDRKAADLYGPYAYLNLPQDLESRPIPPDPSHPERPMKITGLYGYLRCPPYLPPRPDGSPGVTGLPRLMKRIAWALDHPSKGKRPRARPCRKGRRR